MGEGGEEEDPLVMKLKEAWCIAGKPDLKSVPGVLLKCTVQVPNYPTLKMFKGNIC